MSENLFENTNLWNWKKEVEISFGKKYKIRLAFCSLHENRSKIKISRKGKKVTAVIVDSSVKVIKDGYAYISRENNYLTYGVDSG